MSRSCRRTLSTAASAPLAPNPHRQCGSSLRNHRIRLTDGKQPATVLRKLQRWCPGPRRYSIVRSKNHHDLGNKNRHCAATVLPGFLLLFLFSQVKLINLLTITVASSIFVQLFFPLPYPGNPPVRPSRKGTSQVPALRIFRKTGSLKHNPNPCS